PKVYVDGEEVALPVGAPHHQLNRNIRVVRELRTASEVSGLTDDPLSSVLRDSKDEHENVVAIKPIRRDDLREKLTPMRPLLAWCDVGFPGCDDSEIVLEHELIHDPERTNVEFGRGVIEVKLRLRHHQRRIAGATEFAECAIRLSA
ncbi:MAG: hypothetical protein ACJAYU_004909, partial [Bradymonadia bacterium]